MERFTITKYNPLISYKEQTVPVKLFEMHYIYVCLNRIDIFTYLCEVEKVEYKSSEELVQANFEGTLLSAYKISTSYT
jgi:hypothetical protein